ncbi:Sec-independent protein translocase protein TatB [Manganibacter manganicus]|uniref:Sec-independent protein translocase protein TatB n=1 Tax=Manganibacter manganicus TaxID=1873176 RepID=A0A1V8RRL4_9HYPH|nr:Sec-independent protein translocase protein TatB [Pseudaminobacter manganicus]OQM75773.1 twin arginine-targeting protein translocase TatB [Pseudaminobacter manganicus]
MFDVGWTEMLVIAVVMIVVVGPKDLPQMLRTMGRMAAKLRNMAGDFQKQFNDALKEAELDDVKKSVDSLRGLNPMTEIRKQLNPFEKAAADVRAGIETAMAPKPAPDPSNPPATEPQPVEPLKNGATEVPGASSVAEPKAMPAAPVVKATAAPKSGSANSTGAGLARAAKTKTTKVASGTSAPKSLAKGRAEVKSPVEKSSAKARAVSAKPASKTAQTTRSAAVPKKKPITKTRATRVAK